MKEESTGVEPDYLSNSQASGGQQLSSEDSTALVDAVQTWRLMNDARQWGFFLAKRQHSSPGDDDGGDADDEPEPQTPGTPGVFKQMLDYKWTIGCLDKYEKGFFDGTASNDCFIAFADPSTDPEHPGWMLRNLLMLVRKRWQREKVQILRYRDVQARRHEAHSTILHIELDPVKKKDARPEEFSSMPKVIGWERNAASKAASKVANLGEYMDPQR